MGSQYYRFGDGSIIDITSIQAIVCVPNFHWFKVYFNSGREFTYYVDSNEEMRDNIEQLYSIISRFTDKQFIRFNDLMFVELKSINGIKKQTLYDSIKIVLTNGTELVSYYESKDEVDEFLNKFYDYLFVNQQTYTYVKSS